MGEVVDVHGSVTQGGSKCQVRRASTVLYPRTSRCESMNPTGRREDAGWLRWVLQRVAEGTSSGAWGLEDK